MSTHLTADWVPSLPMGIAKSFVGWPPFLLDSEPSFGLFINAAAGRTERQWKSVLSWMLGVAGTRQMLRREGYRWIAPMSAFYQEAKQKVDLDWDPAFLPGVVVATTSPNSKSRLRPDYLALRPLAKSEPIDDSDWAVVESKGTPRCLSSPKCPANWLAQARNIEIRVDGKILVSPRHLVVATRVNPNAVRPKTRRLQIRAWNSEVPAERLPLEARVDVASAHLFGLFKNLGLRDNARAVSLAHWRRTAMPEETAATLRRIDVEEIASRAHSELRELTETSVQDDGSEMRVVSLSSDIGTIQVEIADCLVEFTGAIQRAEEPGQAVEAFEVVEAALDRWIEPRTWEEGERGLSVLPCGLRIRLPRNFEYGERR